MSAADKLRLYWPVIVFPTIVFAGTLALTTFVGLGPLGGGDGALVGRPAPPLAMPIAAGDGARSGDRIDLSRLRGRIVVLDFWASWCGPCRQSVPILNRLQERYGARGVEVLGVNVEAELMPHQLQAAHAAFGQHFPTLHDRDGRAQLGYRVVSLPTLVLIDRHGVVRLQESGVPDESHIASEIEHYLE
jgi:thiol-disulfide isomerase/thioredoxin